ncbi:MAG: hypothetical protein Q9175_002943 [Cornicularia normoerica]
MAESKPASLSHAHNLATEMLASVHDSDFDYNLCKALTVVSASLTPMPRVVTRLTVTLAMCNTVGSLHGGAISTLFDVCTTVALVTARRWEMAGVTRTLSITCLAPAFPGEEIEIEGEVAQIGKKLGKGGGRFEGLCNTPANPALVIAHILAKMTLVRNGKLLATGVHDKANIDPPAVMAGRNSKL